MAQKRQTKTKQTSKQTMLDEPVTNMHVGRRILAVTVIFFLIVSALKLGPVGTLLSRCLMFVIGIYILYPLYILTFILAVYVVFKGTLPYIKSPLGIGLILSGLGIMVITCYDANAKGIHLVADYVTQGVFREGFLGVLLYGLLSGFFAPLGALIAALIILCIGAFLILSRVYIYTQKESTKEKINEIVDHTPRIETEKLKLPHRKKREDPIFPDSVFAEENKKPEKKEPEKLVDQKPSTLEFDPETMKLEIKETPEPAKTPTEPVKTTFGSYQLPTIKLLDRPKRSRGGNDEMRYAKDTGERLEELLRQFGVNVYVQDVHIGPTVTKYELKLEIGTRVNRILQLQDDIQLALAAKEIRIEAPIPGKPFVGIEVPNQTPALVPYSEVFRLSQHDASWSNKMAVPLGKDVSGNLVVAQLDKMPHLLVAGATGSGKSVCINVIITSILMKATPDEVRMILVDPKKVELTNYNGIPHLLAPVVTDAKKAAGTLQEVVAEMERRYELFAAHGVRNMKTYNTYAREYNASHEEGEPLEILPYHLIILDEVADLMMVASKTVEDCIMRISQMARAAGIHMIVATQRPSTDIITGVIKANIPSRIAFSVSSSVDSRTILDATGAEKLLGNGDMLFSPMGSSSPIRVQGAFVSDAEVERVVDFASHQIDTNYEEKYVEAKEVSNTSSGGVVTEENDEEYEECRAFVIQAQKASTSLLQRKFRIGYNKAARIIEQLEENGVIGPQIGSKPREVYIKSYHEDDEA